MDNLAAADSGDISYLRILTLFYEEGGAVGEQALIQWKGKKTAPFFGMPLLKC